MPKPAGGIRPRQAAGSRSNPALGTSNGPRTRAVCDWASATMAGHSVHPVPVARLDHSPQTLDIIDLSHDGRGVARWPEGQAHAGKTVFVAGALLLIGPTWKQRPLHVSAAPELSKI